MSVTNNPSIYTNNVYALKYADRNSWNPKFLHSIVQRYLGYIELSTLSSLCHELRQLANHDIQWKFSMDLVDIHTTTYIKTNALRRDSNPLYDQTLALLVKKTLRGIKFDQKLVVEFYTPRLKAEILKRREEQFDITEVVKDALCPFLKLEIYFSSEKNKRITKEKIDRMEPQRIIRYFFLEEQMAYRDQVPEIFSLSKDTGYLKMAYRSDVPNQLKQKITEVFNSLTVYKNGYISELTPRLRGIALLRTTRYSIVPGLVIIGGLLAAVTFYKGYTEQQAQKAKAV